MRFNLAKNPAIPFLTSTMGSLPCGISQMTLEGRLGSNPRRSRRCSDAVSRPFCAVGCRRTEEVATTRLIGSSIRKARSDPVRVRAGNYCNGSDRKMGEGASGGIDGEKLPWIAAYNGRKVKVPSEKAAARADVSSWEESASRYFSRKGGYPVDARRGSKLVDVEESKSAAGGLEEGEDGEPMDDTRWVKMGKKHGRFVGGDSGQGSPEVSWSNRHNEWGRGMVKEVAEGSEEGEDDEPIDDPRWDSIRKRYGRFVGRDSGHVRQEMVRSTRQEEWGRRMVKEATSSSVPRIVGEAVYGIGPVLAALMVGRREFYVLYVQEGLDSAGLNKKKRKDRKRIDTIFHMAETLGLTVKDSSKHDLNMVVDNRPHQGVVLDASPLEMVGVKELDPLVSVNDRENVPVWVALDEVTDPQNLGAILRSCYFFGVKGVVVCAKNSAPLSGVVSKASAGSLEMIEVRSCKNMMNFLSASVKNGWRVIGGSVSSKAQSLSEVQSGIPTILVLGSEGSGLRPLVERSCTQLVKIPGSIPLEVDANLEEDEPTVVEDKEANCSRHAFKPFVAVESLNVSVAAGVLLYHLSGRSNCSVVGNQVVEE